MKTSLTKEVKILRIVLLAFFSLSAIAFIGSFILELVNKSFPLAWYMLGGIVGSLLSFVTADILLRALLFLLEKAEPAEASPKTEPKVVVSPSQMPLCQDLKEAVDAKDLPKAKAILKELKKQGVISEQDYQHLEAEVNALPDKK
jgi:uncharacterized membrane protein